MRKATGSFSVTLTPQAVEPGVGPAGIGRFSLHKQYQGDLQAEALGQMLAIRTPVDGSAAYVALEGVEGELHGRRGGFSLHHRGIMDRSSPALEVWVVPDSGTGALAGIRGRLDIRIEGKAHFYDLEYELPQTQE